MTTKNKYSSTRFSKAIARRISPVFHEIESTKVILMNPAFKKTSFQYPNYISLSKNRLHHLCGIRHIFILNMSENWFGFKKLIIIIKDKQNYVRINTYVFLMIEFVINQCKHAHPEGL